MIKVGIIRDIFVCALAKWNQKLWIMCIVNVCKLRFAICHLPGKDLKDLMLSRWETHLFEVSIVSCVPLLSVCLYLPFFSLPSSCSAVNPLHRGCRWRLKCEARARLRLYLVAHAGHESKHSHPRCPLPVEGGNRGECLWLWKGVFAHSSRFICVATRAFI